MGASMVEEDLSFLEVEHTGGGSPLTEEKAKQELAKLRDEAVSLKKKLAAKLKADAVKFAKKRAQINKRIAARSREMVARHNEIKAIKPYKGKIGLGNFMRGGPKSKPATAKNWLTDFQHRIFSAKAATPNLDLRKRIGQRLKELYKAAKIPEQGFLAKFLRDSGVKKTTAATIRTTWQKAKDWYVKQMFDAYLVQKAQKAKAKKARAERKRLAALKAKNKDKTDYHTLPKVRILSFPSLQQVKESLNLESYEYLCFRSIQAEADRLMIINNILEDDGAAEDENLSGTENSVEFYGCVDCASGRDAKVKFSTELDTKEHAKDLEKRGGKPKHMIKKKSKKAKKPKAGKPSAAQLAARKKEFAKFSKMMAPKLTIDNQALLTHLLDRFAIDRNAIDIKNIIEDVKTKIRDRIVEKQLRPEEQEELLKAKVEALEMAVAGRAGVPVMKKRLRNVHLKPRRKLPSFDPPKTKKNSKEQLKRDVAISFGSGYLSDGMRWQRQDIDFGSQVNDEAQKYNDELLSRGFTDMETKPVWEKFDGPGGDHKQQRAEIINKHRKRYPNEPLDDGSAPW